MFFSVILFMFLINIDFYKQAYAAPVVPPAADALRFQEERDKLLPKDFQPEITQEIKPAIILSQAVPENAGEIVFELKDLQIEGLEVYDVKKFLKLWREDIGQTISLAKVYDIASRITAEYRNDGYFLSRAYVPAQTIDDGIVKISVIEGYISVIDFAGELPSSAILENFHEKILTARPLNIKTLERQMLLLNDFPSIRFRTVLKTLSAEDDSSIVLALIGESKDTGVRSFVSYDNSGSRYIGPSIVNARFSFAGGDIIPEFHETTLSLSATPDSSELGSISLTHKLPLTFNGLNLSLSAGYLEGAPGFDLTVNEVRSKTVSLGAEIIWDAVRLRTENTRFKLGFDLKDSQTDILGAPLSRDHIRSLKFHAHRDWQDSYRGFTTLEAIVSKGLSIAGASKTGDTNLSRAEGRPDFLRLEASAYRLQNITGPWNIQLGFSGQLTGSPLLSSQQFGYGGQSFGRAYDGSEITGDKGAAVMAELRYEQAGFLEKYHLQHFLFQDYGKVWNLDASAIEQSAGSLGIGTRLRTPTGINASLTLAQPLILEAATPQMGSATSPRLLFSASSNF